MAKKLTKKSRKKTSEPAPLFGGHEAGRIWVVAGVRLTDDAIGELIVKTGRRDFETSWGRSVPLDRLPEGVRRRLIAIHDGSAYIHGSISLSYRTCASLPQPPSTEEAIIAWMIERIEECFSEAAVQAAAAEA